jgi:hypothetical protein
LGAGVLRRPRVALLWFEKRWKERERECVCILFDENSFIALDTR